MTEADVVAWLVGDGAAVTEGEPIYTLEMAQGDAGYYSTRFGHAEADRAGGADLCGRHCLSCCR